MKNKFGIFVFTMVLVKTLFSVASNGYLGLNQDQVSKIGKEVSGGVWAKDLIVDIREIKAGSVELFLIEAYGNYKTLADGIKRRDTRVVDSINIAIDKDEKIADGGSFRCREHEISVIGIFKKRLAKEKGTFSATRAWKVDTSSKRFVALHDNKSVVCDWFRNGDETFPKL